MKLFKTSPLLCMVAACTIFISVISYVFADTVYANYSSEYDEKKAPIFVLALRGASDGVFPWTLVELPSEVSVVPEEIVEEQKAIEEAAIVEEITEPEVLIEEASADASDIAEEEAVEEDEDKTYELTEVTPEYFEDALFIGDSRTVGLSEYVEELDEKATFYAKVSLTIYGVLEKQFLKTDDGKMSIEEALQDQQFGKIYISLGLNEIGTGTAETFAESYSEVIERLKELQPDAIIFIQGIMHVAERKSSEDKYFNNENINRRNEVLSQLADNKTVFYIDMNEAVDDENGNLQAGLSFDDIHLKASSYQLWYDFLLGHGIVKD